LPTERSILADELRRYARSDSTLADQHASSQHAEKRDANDDRNDEGSIRL